MCVFVVSFFFFKQKTAYEMRISDWSSDVCSSDLGAATGDVGLRRHPEARELIMTGLGSFLKRGSPRGEAAVAPAVPEGASLSVNEGVEKRQRMLLFGVGGLLLTAAVRSEEHTSELQSLMRISYAVFCLKKKKTNTK